MCRILIAADIVPTVSNFKEFINNDAEFLIGKELLDLVNSADYVIMNLEVPLIDESDPIYKWGPALKAPKETIKGLRTINRHFFSLANNHIMDQGEKGLLSTINELKKYNISFSGAGENVMEAAKPFTINIDGLKIGIYCCVEHEFSYAAESSPGANPFDPLKSYDEIEKMRIGCDYIIVLYHGGKEHYRYPSPKLQKRLRKFVEKGADLVITQHSHCIGCEEQYKHGTIIYGQGNFLFDYNNEECWREGLIVDLKLSKENVFVDYIPIKKDRNRVRICNELEKVKIMQEFKKRSYEILEHDFIIDNYRKMALNNMSILISRNDYLARTIIFRVFNKLTKGLLLKYYSKRVIKKLRYSLLNNYECEAWNELMITLLRNENGELQ